MDLRSLIARFDDRGTLGTCPTCGGEDVKILEASELSSLFGGLKRYYDPLIGDPYRLGKYGIYGIGPNSGEDSLVVVLREDWDVFSDSVDDELAEGILEFVWPGYVGEYQQRGRQSPR